MTFLFWNIGKRDIAPVASALALQHNVDILLLAENDTAPAQLLELLNTSGTVRYNYIPPPGARRSKVDVFFGYSPDFISPQSDTGRVTIRKIALPGRMEILLCGVHLQSRTVWEDPDQATEATLLNAAIREEEAKAGHSRTVVVGDLNMNPKSPGSILKEQAALLGQKTNNLVRAEVKAGKDEDSGNLVFSFRLVAPALDNYKLWLFTVEHMPTQLYPLSIMSDVVIPEKTAQGRWRAETEQELKDHLKMLFSDKRTLTAIQSLLAQSKDYAPPKPATDDCSF